MIDPSTDLLPKFLTSEVAQKATNLILQMVMGDEGQQAIWGLKRRHCHIVVLVPAMKTEGREYPDYPIEPFALYQHSIGGMEHGWEHDYREIAQCKALQLWHGRHDSRTDCRPHLLFPGDTPYWGGVKRHGVVVACSGQQPWFDKMISGMIADGCTALAYEAWTTSKDREEGHDFILEPSE